MRISIFFLFLITSCGCRSCPNVEDLSPTKQKQKIVLLKKKLQLAEREEKKIQSQIEKLSEEMREAQLAYIRKQVDEYEILYKNAKKKIDIESGDLFLEEREQLYRMLQSGGSSFEAQLMLDRILQLITELSDERME